MTTATPDDATAATAERGLAYAVLDLETTGLDEAKDSIIEVAVVGLTADLDTELFAFTEVVKPTRNARDRLALAPQDVLDMHKANGLLDDLDRADLRSLREIENDLCILIDIHAAQGTDVYLSGSGVSHFDHRFIRKHMPRLWSRFHYAIADVGVMRRFYRQQTGAHLSDANLGKTHRALDDVRCHIEELRDFRAVFLSHSRQDKHRSIGATA